MKPRSNTGPIPRILIDLGTLLFLAFAMGGCQTRPKTKSPASVDQPPGSSPSQAANDDLEGIAVAELDKLGDGSQKWRYEEIVSKYPATIAAATAKAKLVQIGYNTLITTSPGSATWREFLNKYAYDNDLLTPSQRQAYQVKTHPLFLDVFQKTKSWDQLVHFIHCYPDGPTHQQCQALIASIIAETADPWEANQIASTYLTECPSLPEAQAEAAASEDRLFVHVKGQSSELVVQRFLRTFPKSKYREQLLQQQISLHLKTALELHDEAALRRFLKENPDSPVKNTIQAELARIQSNTESFQKAVASPTISELKAFLAAEPTNIFADKAKALLLSLEYDALPADQKEAISALVIKKEALVSSAAARTSDLGQYIKDLRNQQTSLQEQERTRRKDSASLQERAADLYQGAEAERRRARAVAGAPDTFSGEVNSVTSGQISNLGNGNAIYRSSTQGQIRGSIESQDRNYDYHMKEAERLHTEATECERQADAALREASRCEAEASEVSNAIRRAQSEIDTVIRETNQSKRQINIDLKN